ncbi:Eco29kI family restriction endonuclease [Litoribacillus peritrichatus]|uniref:Eco29kI family restriction endonuclease n=1 Tax=Litoribacillus peritrichatus TaxID=718191 RepID=A0ABP7MQ31_9GAMM
MVDVTRQVYRSNVLIQLSKNAIQFLENTPKHSFPIPATFYGSGVYALYYTGDHPKYKSISRGIKPIYVGKAVPTGWRTGAISRKNEPKLKSRLSEHARSIEHANDLNIKDFQCRFIIIPPEDAAIISVIESTLISSYRPIWNTTIDGFGNHDPGSGRYNQAKSQWDILHQGRPWANKLTG